MCTVIILRRPGHDWPVVLGANRDEMLDRAWQPPARHWPDWPDVVAGLDELAGGTWMGLNDAGVVACILNRHGSLGPAAGKRSRGELVLEALDHADAADAATAMSYLSPAAYRSFNMVIADNRDAWWVTLRSGDPTDRVEIQALPEGLSMFTSGDRNDTRDPRVAAHLPRLQAAAPPDPDRNDWESWRAILASTESPDGEPVHAMSFATPSGFGTSSSSLLALPSMEAGPAGKRPIWLFAPGSPDRESFAPVDL